MPNLNYDLTQPLPGWLRFQNMETGQMMDVNPADCVQRILLERYSKHPKWRIINHPARGLSLMV